MKQTEVIAVVFLDSFHLTLGKEDHRKLVGFVAWDWKNSSNSKETCGDLIYPNSSKV
jgi:hypothetical protein